MTDRELENVVKASASTLYDDGGSDATRLLQNSYEQTPSASSMRTPRVAGGEDTILEEAAAQAALMSGSTPLLGGESAAPLSKLGDFGGITPGARQAPTPNSALAGLTPGPGGGRHAAGGSTPAPSQAGGFTPGRSSVGGATPGRDALGINEAGDGVDLSALPPEVQRRVQKERRAALAAQLARLPEPSNEYSIVMPELPADDGVDEDDDDGMEEDAIDAEAREAAAAAAAEAAEMAKRSTALQRSLPRPLLVNREAAAPPTAAEAAALGGDALAAADRLLREEVVKMLEADACAYPVKGAPEARKKRPLKPLPPEALAAAREAIAAEAAALAAADPPPPAAELAAAAEAAAADLAYVPSQQRYAPLSSASSADQLQSAQQQLQLVKNFMERDAKKAAKLEKKLDVTLGGYKKREGALRAELLRLQQELQQKTIEAACFAKLHSNEALAVPQRLSQMAALVSEQTAREAELQARYKQLSAERQALADAK